MSGLMFAPTFSSHNPQESVVDVMLRRACARSIADKVSLFDLFVKLSNHVQKTCDIAGQKYIGTALDLWTQIETGLGMLWGVVVGFFLAS